MSEAPQLIKHTEVREATCPRNSNRHTVVDDGSHAIRSPIGVASARQTALFSDQKGFHTADVACRDFNFVIIVTVKDLEPPKNNIWVANATTTAFVMA